MSPDGSELKVTVRLNDVETGSDLRSPAKGSPRLGGRGGRGRGGRGRK